MNKKGDFLSSVASSCQQSFFDDCSKIIVGLSGGPDSVFLFLLLLRLKKTYGFSLHALHINHQLRGEESQSDEQFVRNLCRTYNVPLHISPAAVADHAKAQNISIEMAARELRYNAFLHYAEELSATHISTGHTADDKIETALMRLITGCGIEGLTGLRSSRLYKGRIFIRPLLSYWKSDIVHWLDMNSVPYRIDASNKSDAYFRNKIRNKLIPFIVKEFNPNFKATLSHSLELLEKTASALEDTVPQKSNFYIYKSDSLYIFSKKVLLSYPDGIISAVIQKTCFAVSSAPIRVGYTHISRLMNNLRKPHSAFFDFPSSIIAGCDSQFVYVGNTTVMQGLISPSTFSFSFQAGSTLSFTENFLSCTIKTYAASHTAIPQKTHITTATWDTLYAGGEIDLTAVIMLEPSSVLHARSRNDGDIILTPHGTRKLKKLYIDYKIPLFLRNLLPVITHNENIIWTPVTQVAPTPAENLQTFIMHITLKMNF